MLKKLFTIFCLLSFCSCTVSQQFINPKRQNQIKDLNRKIKNKNIKIDQVIGNTIETSNVRVSKDSLFYSSSNQKSIPISNVNSLTVSPKVNGFSILGALLFGSGTYSTLTASDSDNLVVTPIKFFGGIGLIILGVTTLILGKNAFNHVYVFNQIY